MFTTSYKLQATSYRGFTLIEVVVSVFVFLVIMMSVSQTFTTAFHGYSLAKTAQKELETAQFAVNTMAKILRDSSIVSSSGSQTTVRFYEHAQGKCFEYKINATNNTIEMKSDSVSGTAPMGEQPDVWKTNQCGSMSFSSGYVVVASSVHDGNFQVVPSDGASTPKVLGKITISLVIGEDVDHLARMQTTVSLRDYGVIGL